MKRLRAWGGVEGGGGIHQDDSRKFGKRGLGGVGMLLRSLRSRREKQRLIGKGMVQMGPDNGMAEEDAMMM